MPACPIGVIQLNTVCQIQDHDALHDDTAQCPHEMQYVLWHEMCCAILLQTAHAKKVHCSEEDAAARAALTAEIETMKEALSSAASSNDGAMEAEKAMWEREREALQSAAKSLLADLEAEKKNSQQVTARHGHGVGYGYGHGAWCLGWDLTLQSGAGNLGEERGGAARGHSPAAGPERELGKGQLQCHSTYAHNAPTIVISVMHLAGTTAQ